MIDNSDISTGDIYAVLQGATNPTELKLRRIADGIMRKVGDHVARAEVEVLTKGSAENRQDMMAFGIKGFTRIVGQYVTEYEDKHTRVLKNDLHSSFDSFASTVPSLARKIALRMVLAEREHIPNKPEAKEARRKAATAHHGPKKKGGSRVAKKYEERKLAQNPWRALPKESKQKRERRRRKYGW
jgi:DNA polymerase elongation subunit (family B)